MLWQKFTEKAREAIYIAQEEAKQYGDRFVDTEHILLGVLQAPDSVACQILDLMGVPAERIISLIRPAIARRDTSPTDDLHLTPQAKRVIDLAYEEARRLRNNYIGTEHLLLGLIHEAKGLAGQNLIELRVTLEAARSAVTQLQCEGQRGIWQRFTKTSQEAVVFAQQEAASYGQNYVEPEHLLLGILRNTENTACQVLDQMDILPERVVTEVRTRLTAQDRKVTQDMQLTPRAKKAIDLAFAESLSLQYDTIQTEHLLLGLIRVSAEGSYRLLGVIPLDNTVVTQVFKALRITVDDARAAIRRIEEGR